MKVALLGLLLTGAAGCAGTTASAPYWAQVGASSPYLVGNVTVYVEEPHQVAARCAQVGLARVNACWWLRGGRDYIAVPAPETPDAFWLLLHEFKHVFEGQFHP